MKRLGYVIGQATELGMVMGLTSAGLVILGLIFGRWLDARLGTTPIATVAFLLAGAVSGQVAIYRLAMRASGRLRADGERAGSVRDAGTSLVLAAKLLLVMIAPVFAGLGVGLALLRGGWVDDVVVPVLVLVGFALGLAGAVRVFRRATT